MRTKRNQPRLTSRALQGTGKLKAGCLRYEVRAQDRKGLNHVLLVDSTDFSCSCTCEHFHYRVRQALITDNGARLCKHLRTYQSRILKDLAAAIGVAA